MKVQSKKVSKRLEPGFNRVKVESFIYRESKDKKWTIISAVVKGELEKRGIVRLGVYNTKEFESQPNKHYTLIRNIMTLVGRNTYESVSIIKENAESSIIELKQLLEQLNAAIKSSKTPYVANIFLNGKLVISKDKDGVEKRDIELFIDNRIGLSLTEVFNNMISNKIEITKLNKPGDILYKVIPNEILDKNKVQNLNKFNEIVEANISSSNNNDVQDISSDYDPELGF